MAEMMAQRDKALAIKNLLEQRINVLREQWPTAAETGALQRFVRSVVSACMEAPALLDCAPQAIFREAMIAARMGLEVGRAMRQAALVPFKGKPQLIVQYEGMVHVAWIGNRVRVSAEAVHEHDDFEYHETESGPHLRWSPAKGEPGALVGAWARFTFSDGLVKVRYVPGWRIERIKQQALARAGKKPSPWGDPAAEPEMWMKTAVRSGWKLLPKDAPAVCALNEQLAAEDGELGVDELESTEDEVIIEQQGLPAPAEPNALKSATDALKAKAAPSAEPKTAAP